MHRWKNNSSFFFVEPFVFGIPRNHALSLSRFEHNFRPRLKAFFLFFLIYIRGKHVYGHGGVTANGSRKILRPLYFLDLLTLLRIVDTPLHRIFQSCVAYRYFHNIFETYICIDTHTHTHTHMTRIFRGVRLKIWNDILPSFVLMDVENDKTYWNNIRVSSQADYRPI